MNTLVRIVICAVIFTCSSTVLAEEESAVKAKIELTYDVKQPPIESDYIGCGDRLYARFSVSDESLGDKYVKKKAKIQWINPQGEVQEGVDYDALYLGSKPATYFAWLQLKAAPGAGVFRLVAPSAGLGEYVGTWQVRLVIDGEKVEEKEFFMNC